MTDTTGSVVDTGNPQANTADTSTTTTATTPAWTAALENVELKGYAELKGWKDPAAAIESYRQLEKFQGVPPDRLAKIPEAEDKEGWAAFNKRLGWAPPDKPDDYALPVPEGMADTFAKVAQAKFHEFGVPKELGQKIAGWANEFTLAQMDADNKAINTAHEQDAVKLKSEWGANHDALVETAKRAVAEYMPKTGLQDADMDAIRDAIGTAKFNKLWAGVGSTMGEAAFVEGNTTVATGAMTPDAAKVRLQQLGQDKEWFQRKEAGGVKENNEYQLLRTIVANATLQSR